VSAGDFLGGGEEELKRPSSKSEVHLCQVPRFKTSGAVPIPLHTSPCRGALLNKKTTVFFNESGTDRMIFILFLFFLTYLPPFKVMTSSNEVTAQQQ
jgi:hypothetical protein